MKENSAAMAHMSAMVTSCRVLQRFVFSSSTCLVACVADMTASFSQGGFLRVRFSPCTKKRARMNSFTYGPANTHCRHASATAVARCDSLPLPSGL